jgi:lipoprotein-anchoring transpeptidase ErfK/SrfK
MTGARTVLPLLGQAIDSTGGSWLHVRLPGRALKGKQPPESGWISAARTRTSATDWHLVVNRAARSVTVYRNGQKLRSYKAIVGKSSTPTPRGEFFVEENVRLPGGRPGAPFALATSARSSVFQEFEGGPGQIALHGLTNVGGSLGTAVSHGCVRMANRSISWLAARIKPGDPVTIV